MYSRECLSNERCSGSKPDSIAISLNNFPFLNDHCFEEAAVLPASAYVNCVLRAHHSPKESPLDLCDLSFESPVFLSCKETVLEMVAQPLPNGGVEYSFAERRVVTGHSARQICAKLRINDRATLPEPLRMALEIAGMSKSRPTFSGIRFYELMRENGNYYGPAFQTIEQLWLAGHDGFAIVRLPLSAANQEQRLVVLLDSAVQAAAALELDHGHAFLLRSADCIHLFDRRLPEALRIHVQRRPSSIRTGLLQYDVDAFGLDGSRLFSLRNLALSFSHPGNAELPRPTLRIAVGATFTAEPIQESIHFWSDYFHTTVHVDFAPYGQVFQTLLDPTGVLHRGDPSGVNVILLDLLDLVSENSNSAPKPAAIPDASGLTTHLLPNGISIFHFNRHETEYLYHEIFEEQTYLKHGIELNDGDTVIDVGANVGLFSVFITSRCPNATVFALEPNPDVFRILDANCRAHSPRLRAINAGVSNRAGYATFRFYEHASVFSGFHPDIHRDRQAMQAVVRNMLRAQTDDDGQWLEDAARELTKDRLQSRTIACRLISISDLIRDHQICQIHLLKIDAEGSEVEVLRGIADEHWPLIDQVVVEVHDAAGKILNEVTATFEQRGYSCVVDEEALLKNSGLFNVYARRAGRARARDVSPRFEVHHDQPVPPSPSAPRFRFPARVDEFTAALEAFRARSSVPLILCLCPSDPERAPDIQVEISEAEARLAARAGLLPDTFVISPNDLFTLCPASEFFDRDAMDLGHIPFTPEGFAAIGTRVFRTLAMSRQPPRKVVILDCDHTLWDGACGEVGFAGVQINSAHRDFQEFMVECAKAGMLLCLCSKNHEQDVFEVLDRRGEMVLRREHLAAWRINWQRKSENIRSLALELGLGLDSIIFVDDDPVECAEVRSACPEVLILQAPREPSQIAAWARRVWAFDRIAVTEADRQRTRMYQENRVREAFRQNAPSLKSFLHTLGLQVTVSELRDEDMSRAAQLTFRTNQFNFTTIRRTESELREQVRDRGFKALSVHVQDRFGDYGLVGLILFEPISDRYRVDTLLLSCRVLGKGVEHQVLRDLACRARAGGKSLLEIQFRRTDRNEPAAAFLAGLVKDFEPVQPAPGAHAFSCESLVHLKHDPESGLAESSGRNSSSFTETKGTAAIAPSVQYVWNERMQEVANRLFDARAVLESIAAARGLHSTSGAGALDEEPGLEARLLRIWRSVLGRDDLTLTDNFFDAGGTSLGAVRLVTRIRKELSFEMALITLFECPSVKQLAERLEPRATEGNRNLDAFARGLQRRRILRREIS